MNVGDLIINKNYNLCHNNKKNKRDICHCTNGCDIKLWSSLCVKDILCTSSTGSIFNPSFLLREYFHDYSAYIIGKFEERKKELYNCKSVSFKYDMMIKTWDGKILEAHSDKMKLIIEKY